MYINVSWDESLRKNRERYNPEKPDSILEHGLPDSKLELMYKESDWEALCAASPAHLDIQGYKVPYAIFENEDDVTTGRGESGGSGEPGGSPDPLGQRLEETLQLLWERYTR